MEKVLKLRKRQISGSDSGSNIFFILSLNCVSLASSGQRDPCLIPRCQIRGISGKGKGCTKKLQNSGRLSNLSSQLVIKSGLRSFVYDPHCLHSYFATPLDVRTKTLIASSQNPHFGGGRPQGLDVWVPWAYWRRMAFPARFRRIKTTGLWSNVSESLKVWKNTLSISRHRLLAVYR